MRLPFPTRMKNLEESAEDQDQTLVAPDRRSIHEEEEKSASKPNSRRVSFLPEADQRDSAEILRASVYHEKDAGSGIFDPNIDPEFDVLEDDSPYPEVRSAVANFDDPDMPVSTLRTWVLGLLWAVILPAVNQFFFFRFPAVLIGGLVAMLVVYPMGRFWERFFPSWRVLGVSLNPGPFTIKEHVLVTVMASISAQSAYATQIIATQRVYYNQVFSFPFQWMLVMSTQLIGFSIGGITRRLLAEPPSMIWPNVLVLCAVFNTLHSQNYAGMGNFKGLSRELHFLYALLGATLWYLLPGYLFQALSYFTWVCWIAPNNVVGIEIESDFWRSGFGFSVLTFDWNQITYIGSPLATPWWAQVNVLLGFIFFFWIIAPILYYRNTWYSQYLPVMSTAAYDNTGQPYNLTRVMSGGRLDVEAYKAYSPLYISIALIMNYGLSFMAVTATITHTIVYWWKPVRLHFKRSLREQPDVHARLMSKYQHVPDWWYGCLFVITFAFGAICIELWPTDMPIWALIVALVIVLVFIIPFGMIEATTNRQIGGINVLTELLVGYMIPGRALPMMMYVFKLIDNEVSFLTVYDQVQDLGVYILASSFTEDLKLGHYMKIPPRPMFWGQVISTVIAGTVQLGMQDWMFKNIPDMCDRNQKNGFSCPNTHLFGTSSIIWGVIGPALQFSRGTVYYGNNANTSLSDPALAIHEDVASYMAELHPFPVCAANVIPWAAIGFLFQRVIRRRYFGWWAKYNYVLSAALDTGTALGIILIFFCLQYPLNGRIGEHSIQTWWGNTVIFKTSDWNGEPLKTVAPGETFGPPP
uniref:Putative small oligopeptide transporter n=1 Tax=Moniliophthora roreri TaxID=221103 RepID=A0A0W0FUN2_MONRR